jgi:hypothetical protein
MNSNPIVERQKAAEDEHRKSLTFRYPYRVCCVYLPDDGYDFPIFREMKQYCDGNNLVMYSRPYNIEKHEEDLFVKRTLAFHVYHKGYVQETHYYDENPVYKVQLLVWAYQDVEREKARARQRRQERWEKVKDGWNSIFTLDHFKRKPALDREASLTKDRMEVRKDEEQRISPDSGANAPGSE